MKDSEVRKKLSPVIEAFQTGLGDNLISLVLFGSQARESAHSVSDWDLLVIAMGLPDKIIRRNRGLLALLPLPWRCRVSVLAKTPAEFEAALSSLYLDIALDGVVLYDRHKYIREKLGYIRRRIKQMGLKRQKLNEDWLWSWKRPPGINWELEWS